jgi:hypothetical protein
MSTYESDKLKKSVLERFPSAKCKKEEHVPIFVIIANGKKIGVGFSEASAWVDASRYKLQ